MVKLELYLGNIHQINPNVIREWPMPPRAISLRNFRLLLARRSAAAARPPPPPRPAAAVAAAKNPLLRHVVAPSVPRRIRSSAPRPIPPAAATASPVAAKSPLLRHVVAPSVPRRTRSSAPRPIPPAAASTAAASAGSIAPHRPESQSGIKKKRPRSTDGLDRCLLVPQGLAADVPRRRRSSAAAGGGVPQPGIKEKGRKGSERLKETKGVIGSRLSTIQAGSLRPSAPAGRPPPPEKRKGYDGAPQVLDISQRLASQLAIKDKGVMGSEGLKDTKGVMGRRLSSIQPESGRPEALRSHQGSANAVPSSMAAATGVPQGLASQPGIKVKGMMGSQGLKDTKGAVTDGLSSIQAETGRPEAPAACPSPNSGQKRKDYDRQGVDDAGPSSVAVRTGVPQGLVSQPGIKGKGMMGSQGLKDTKGAVTGSLSSIQAESGRPEAPVGRPSPNIGQKRKDYDRQGVDDAVPSSMAVRTGVPQGLASQPGIKEKGLKDTKGKMLIGRTMSSFQAESRRPEAVCERDAAAYANMEVRESYMTHDRLFDTLDTLGYIPISNKLDATVDNHDRRSAERKLKDLKEKKHNLVQMLKAVQICMDEVKSRDMQQPAKVEQKITRQGRQQSSPQQSMPSKSLPATSLVRPAHGTLQKNEDPKGSHPDPQDDETQDDETREAEGP